MRPGPEKPGLKGENELIGLFKVKIKINESPVQKTTMNREIGLFPVP